MSVLHKKSILLKTLQVGGSTILSRVLGLTREVLMVRYMGTGIVADAFRSAWMLPNMLRQIFAEGALSAAIVPTVVKIGREGKRDQVNQLMTLSFLFFEGIVLALCCFVIWKAEFVIHTVTPGFEPYKAEVAARLLRILMFFIFFISSSALLAGALQSAHHFFVPGISSALMNVFFISGLTLGLWYAWPVEYFCYVILFGGLVQLSLHAFMYFKLGFKFTSVTGQTLENFKPLLKKFLPTMISGSVIQLSLLVDTYYASFLPTGSVTLMGISSGFLRLALGLVVAFATVLLPHFSRVYTYAPKRLSFYLLETAKLIFWLAMPVMLLLTFLSEKIFYTMFYSDKFSLAQVAESQLILSAFLLGLFFLSMNKILLSMYYSLHEMWIPASITIVATLCNIGLNSVLVNTYHATGLAIATSVTSAMQTVAFVVILHTKFKFRMYHKNLLAYMMRYSLQIICFFALFYVVYNGILRTVTTLDAAWIHRLTMTSAYWLWAGPLCLSAMLGLYMTRHFFKVRLYFLK